MLAGIGISALVGPSVHEVIIDLGHVTFFDASAVAALVTIQHGANDRHTALWLANVPDRVSRLLALTGVLPFFNVENEGSRQEPPQPSSDLDDVSRRHRWTYPRHQPSLTHRTPGRR
jgi:MFS superfamily sulfate permease-like transporter